MAEHFFSFTNDCGTEKQLNRIHFDNLDSFDYWRGARIAAEGDFDEVELQTDYHLGSSESLSPAQGKAGPAGFACQAHDQEASPACGIGARARPEGIALGLALPMRLAL